jgi:AbrB family looped-hinge helix DNA binding protein
MELGTLTSKGQTTIPAEIRRHFGLNDGDRLQFFVEGDHIVMVPAKGSVTELKGIIPKPDKPVSIEEMKQAVRSEASSRLEVE